jgi:DHA1 family bicyclomycin/chloramphenicol resistance-like MFS transporter
VAIAGTALAVLGALAAAAAPNIATLIAARMLQGAGAAAGMVVGRALVQDSFSGAARTRAMGCIGMALGLCPPLATVIGGQLHVRLGWQANFIVVAFLGLALIALLWRAVPNTQPHGNDASRAPAPASGAVSMWQAYGQLSRTPSFLATVLMVACTTAAFYAFLAGAPIVLKGYGIGPERIGFIVMCVPLPYIVGNFATTRLAHRLGEQRLLAVGQVLTLIGVLALVGLAAAGARSVAALVLPLMVVGLGHGFLAPTALAITVGLAPRLAGAAAGVAGSAQQWVGALGAYGVGLVTHDGALQLGALMLGWTLLALAAYARVATAAQGVGAVTGRA